ncbi:hypothetical protein L0337_00525 [candidate division KSB1 bacterium]|nr:hypothetical protein [candidate division KSB1 bacterium]
MNNEDNIRALAVAAVLALRSRVRWKPGKDIQHLEKRIRVGHLQAGTAMDEYNRMISEILRQPDSEIYHYPFDGDDYFGVVGNAGEIPWLIILSAAGMMETAFPPKDPINYLQRRNFIYLGKMSEMIP